MLLLTLSFRHGAVAVAIGCLIHAVPSRAADAIATIDRVKGSVVAIGTLQRTRVPAFRFLATGFAVGDGSLVATNAHALPGLLDIEHRETMAIMLPASGKDAQVREAREVAVDAGTDLAVLKVSGPALPPLRLGDSEGVREGQSVLFTGFPIGNVLGPYPATHRGMVSAITPIVIPPATSAELNPQVFRRLTAGAYPVLQLDATAYPGNSGSPVYDPDSGEVIGIINMVFVKGTKETALTQPSGITYAIPVKHLRNLLSRAN